MSELHPQRVPPSRTRHQPTDRTVGAAGQQDRFLILDDTVYHLGASLKDLGKKLFAFSRMEIPADEVLPG